MIPEPDEILAGYRFAVRRWNLQGRPSAAGVRAAVEDARGLLALNQARAIGKRLRTDRDEMNVLLVRIAKRELEFPDVSGWFRARMVG